MPCYIVVQILIEDSEATRQALSELGFIEGRDYIFVGSQIQLLSPEAQAQEGKIKQFTGVIKAEKAFRRKGIKTQRKQLEGDKIELRYG
jgi:hypothetical protein